MKKVIISLLCLTIGATAANAQEKKTVTSTTTTKTTTSTAPAPNPNAGIFKFNEETHNYGEVPEGPLAECDFEFKNVGKEPILIKEAHGSCGCTVPSWPREPIMPGKEAKIHVTYNTKGRQGMIMKEVTITSNAQQSPMVLHIRGTVKPAPKPAVAPPATPASAK